jgi:hypothetical protein
MEKIVLDNKGELSQPVPPQPNFGPAWHRPLPIAVYVAAQRIAADCKIDHICPAPPPTSCGGLVPSARTMYA